VNLPQPKPDTFLPPILVLLSHHFVPLLPFCLRPFAAALAAASARLLFFFFEPEGLSPLFRVPFIHTYILTPAALALPLQSIDI
jgi:hypothetical protein